MKVLEELTFAIANCESQLITNSQWLKKIRKSIHVCTTFILQGIFENQAKETIQVLIWVISFLYTSLTHEEKDGKHFQVLDNL